MPRPRKPAAIRKAEGNRGKRRIPDEMRPDGLPAPPDYLDAEQRVCFAAVVDSLPPGVLCAADQPAVERMAVSWAAFRTCVRSIGATGLLIKAADGKAARHPLWIVMRGACAEMEQAGSSLGLSPVARTRIAQPEKANDDPLALLLGPEGDAWRTGAKKLDS